MKDNNKNFKKKSDNNRSGDNRKNKTYKSDDNRKNNDWKKSKSFKSDDRNNRREDTKDNSKRKNYSEKRNDDNRRSYGENKKNKDWNKNKSYKRDDRRAKRDNEWDDDSEFKSRRSFSRKGEIVKETCIGYNKEGKGLIDIDGNHIVVPGIIKGETAKIEIKREGNKNKAKILEIIDSSSERVKPKCSHFEECGGCQLQHMKYEAQSEYKEKTVKKLFDKYGKVNSIIDMKKPYDYRNKIHSTFASYKRGEVISGIYEENTHRVIPINRCVIQDPQADAIVMTIRKLAKSFKMRPFDEDRQQGFLRHVLVRTGFASGEVMVVFVVAGKSFPSKNNFIKELVKAHPEVTTVLMNRNDRNTTMVLGEGRETVLYGKGTIEDTLCGLKFKISPKSFYQINHEQTEKLYNKAIEMAELRGHEVVLDAYSGIGTISLIASKKSKEVIGVELNNDAIKNAITNAKINGIKNAKFYQGDAGEFMVKLADANHKIDTVFMDPPRSGSDEKFLSSVVSLAPKKVVYISCNPVTQARDLKYLTSKGYKVKEIQPVDMFPHTYHVENIISLVKK